MRQTNHSSGPVVGSLGAYAFDNASDAGSIQLDALSELYDPISQERVRGLVDLKGKRCLEIGLGNGSFALWLAEQVGDGGSVLATDIRPVEVPKHPRLRVIQHDITTDALPEAGFDLVHARAVLTHLPLRRQVLHTMAMALAPGGVLLDEEQQTRPAEEMVAYAADPADAALYVAFQNSVRQILTARGHDTQWARHAYAAFVAEGLEDVDSQVTGESWPGGGAGCLHTLSALRQLRSQLRQLGMTDAQYEELAAALKDDGRLVLHSRLLHSTSGRRPIQARAALPLLVGP